MVLKLTYNLVLPDAPNEIEHNGPEYVIVSLYQGIHFCYSQGFIHKACQCGCKWRVHIACLVLHATEEFLRDASGDSPTAIVEYICRPFVGWRVLYVGGA